MLQLLLSDAICRFSADAVALLAPREGTTDLEVLYTARQGSCGDRFRRAMSERYQSYFSNGDQSALGFIDHLIEPGRLAYLPLFGFSCSMAGALEIQPARILWLGFRDERTLAIGLREGFNHYLSVIARGLREYQQVRAVHDTYTAEKKRSEERARLLAFAAHDMRSPINNLRATLHILSSNPPGAETNELLSVAISNCAMLSSIVDDALDYSRFKAGMLVAYPEVFSCRKMVAEVALGFRQLIQEKKLFLAIDIAEDLELYADRKQIVRILSNVLGNAIKYSDRGTISIVGCTTSSDSIEIAIRDRGPGLSQDEIAQMFQPYTRFGDRSSEGAGLGLALCKIFADLNRCRLAVSSVVGCGTSFGITVPGAHGVAKMVTRYQPEGLANDEKLVLLVDDSPDATTSLQRTLTLYGLRSHSAHSVAEAKSLVHLLLPSVIITDLSFPRGKGEDFVRFLLEQGVVKSVVILSGREVDCDDVDLLTDSRVIYMRKPADIAQLCQVVGAVGMKSETDLLPEAICA